MAYSIAQIISSCPAPVSDASGVSSALAWLAITHAFALESAPTDLSNRDTIINMSNRYFNDIELLSTDYPDINNKLMHIKDLYLAIQSLHP